MKKTKNQKTKTDKQKIELFTEKSWYILSQFSNPAMIHATNSVFDIISNYKISNKDDRIFLFIRG
jgi:hypothetical protein